MLFRKPVPIPDQVRDRLFRDHALTGGLNPTSANRRDEGGMIAFGLMRLAFRDFAAGVAGCDAFTTRSHSRQPLIVRSVIGR